MVSMGTVWDRATEFLSDNIAAIVPLALFAIFVPYSLSASLAPLESVSTSAAGGLYLLSLGLSIVTVWGSLAIMALALDPVAGRGAAIAAANYRLLPALGFALLLLIATLLLVLPVFIALGMAGFDFAAAAAGKIALPPGISGFIALYGVVLAIVVIWVSVRIVLLNPVILMERRGVGAIARSFRLTRAIAFKILGVLILYVVVAMVSYMAAKLVFGTILGLIIGGDGPVTVASVLTSTLASAVQTWFSVLAAAFIAKLYLAVRDAREAIVESA